MNSRLQQSLSHVVAEFRDEFRRIFCDGGVLLIFVVGTLLYPFIFGAIYKNEMVRDVPIAVVDEARCDESRRFARKVDATPEINVRYDCQSMEEAKRLVKERKIHGILYFPKDFVVQLTSRETARIGLFCDMSSFLYYRSVYTGASGVLVDEMRDIQLQRYSLMGLSGEDAEKVVTTVPYDDVKLYCPGGGFTSFLVPALLVLVLHQTLFLGISIVGGTKYEERLAQSRHRRRYRLRHGSSSIVHGSTSSSIVHGSSSSSNVHRDSFFSVMRDQLVRALPYFLLYFVLSAIVLIMIPRWFALPHIGLLSDLVFFVIPFLFAAIFFSLTVTNFVRHRDGGILCFIFFSVILLFMSGTVWPRCNMPWVWKYFSYLFPYTPASQCFVAINSMGSHIPDIDSPYLLLCAQALFYFLLNSVIVYFKQKKERTINGKENRGCTINKAENGGCTINGKENGGCTINKAENGACTINKAEKTLTLS